VPEYAGVEVRRLPDLLAKGAVLADAVDGDAARVVVGDERVRTGGVDAVVNRAGRQRLRLAVWLQCPEPSMRNALM